MTKLFKSFLWAINGIRTVWREEANFRIEVCVSLCVIAIGLYLGLIAIEWLFVTMAIGMVLSAEMVNTALEDLCNKIEPQNNPMIGKIKDIMAGYVLVATVASITMGLVIFSNYL